MNKKNIISFNTFADILGVSRKTVEKWISQGRYRKTTFPDGRLGLALEDLTDIPEIKLMMESEWEDEMKSIPLRKYNSVELFAGAGGLALGLEKSGFNHILLNEINHNACYTLKNNRPYWNIVEEDITKLDFSLLNKQVDLLSGGFPCQAFSYAGKRLGFEETRGTLFFEMARAIKEIQPSIFLCENVKGLVEHDKGRTLTTIKKIIEELGYTLIIPKVLKAILYNVPQKRERLFLIGIRNDLYPFSNFKWPSVNSYVPTLRDAFFRGCLYENDVPLSEGQKYPQLKKEIMDLVPEGGDWRDLPEEVAKIYMKGSYKLEGGKTGMARRLAMDEPSLTLTCAPAQKQTERCHPWETRPLTVREYARIQTFPDDWQFYGSLGEQYKQIGNAVPVNLAWAIGRSLIRTLNSIERKSPQNVNKLHSTKYESYRKGVGLFEGMVCESENTKF